MGSWLLLLLACSPQDAPEETGVPEETGEPVLPLEFESAVECAVCHPRQYAEWRQSMHSYAALSPVFDAMASKAHRDTSGGVGTFCTGCHSPMGTAEGESGTTQAAGRSALSREGVSCDVCHTAVDHNLPIGNANISFLTGSEKVGPYASDAQDGHTSVQGEITVSPVLCGSCHDVFNYPALRIEDAFLEYTTSPAMEEGVRCQDCHMGAVPGVSGEREWGPSAVVEGQTYPDREQATHLFVGPDYSLIDAFPFPDDLEASALAQAENLARIQVLLSNAVRLATVDVHDTEGVNRVEVEVESLTAGHNVPTGFTSERQMWLDVRVEKDGNTVYQSGDLDSYGDLRDEHSWQVIGGELALDTDLVNFQSRNLVRYQEGELFDSVEIYDAVFPFDAHTIQKRSLEPLETRAFTYEIGLVDPPYTVTVALRYRNLPPYVLRALHLEELVDRVQIFTIDETTVSSD